MLQYRIIDENDINGQGLDALLDALPAWRREKAMKFKQEQGRRECAVSYLLLSDMLGFQPEFEVGEHGKPYIVSPSGGETLHFNMSHCKKAIACATDNREVGIDVECMGRYKDRLARYCMCEEELQTIGESEDADVAFTVLWTKKEALLKLTGEGIIDDMKRCLYSNRMEGVRIDSGYDKEKGYAWSVAYME